jgi:hypothetical protein
MGGTGEDSQINADGPRDATVSVDSVVDTGSIDRGKKPMHDQKLPPDQKPMHDQKLPPDQKQPLDGGGLSGQCSDKTKWDCKAQIGICTTTCPTGASSKLYTIMCTSTLSCSCFNQNLQSLPCSYIPLPSMVVCDMCNNAFDNGCCTK